MASPGRHAGPYAADQLAAVYRLIGERQDLRAGFRPDPVPGVLLVRVLAAAHHVPAPGATQPWDFVVITGRERRERIAGLARRRRAEYTAGHPAAHRVAGGQAAAGRFVSSHAADVRVPGGQAGPPEARAGADPVREAPLSIVVTCDQARSGEQAVGRPGPPPPAVCRCALAVAALWLAARAEGLGVCWETFASGPELAAELRLPRHVDVAACLCLGYLRDPRTGPQPEPAVSGWPRHRPLGWAVHAEEYGRRGLPGEEPVSLLREMRATIRPLDVPSMTAARDRQDRLTKPRGSLGVLETVPVQLAGLAGRCPPPLPEPATVAVFAADHGVHAQQVTRWPQEVTAQMVANILAGGAVVNAFAVQAGAEITVIDVGVAGDLAPVAGLVPRKVGWGTADFTAGPAMTTSQAAAAIDVGIEVARDLVGAGSRCLLTGDMGVANSTVSAALICTFTGRDPAEVASRGIDAATFARKVAVIGRGLALHRPDPTDPVRVLAAFGGFEHAALAGFILGAAALRVPVILDGVVAGAAALAAATLVPAAVGCCLAGHRSADAGHAAVLDHLGLRPLIDLGLRLGEGTGGVLALPLVASAVRALRDVASFDSAGVTVKS
jgi:nicotinate-nucleotide--dimethylbenzimidazole phosphoribosyltransferase